MRTAFSLSSEGLCAAAIDEAETAVGLAYAVVREAEQAGADVSGLLVDLNEAGELLARAQVASRLGDSEEADRLAALSAELVSGVAREAEQLRLAALEMHSVRVQLAVAESIIGVAVVVLGGFWAWRLFKRRYVRRVLAMKPEVASDDA